MRLFRKLRRKLDYLPEDQIGLIHQAYLIAYDAHRTQKRYTGEPYITHPVAVACILAEMKMDHQSIMAALLHDVIEDTDIEKNTLLLKFGCSVADLVDGVSKLTQIEFENRDEAQAENFRKMVLAMAQDIRVILVKLADRLHNMRTLANLPIHKQQRIAKETLEIYAPISKRLGMREFSVELEELGFRSLYPMRYTILKESLRRARGNRKKILHLIENTMQQGLENSTIASYEILGREKHLYSIYRKMRNKRLPFNEIMDVYAFRIIVENTESCYLALGLVHGLFKPVPERFKDYIAIPKANGYQSLHTTLFGPYGLPIEIQIRSRDMDKMASSGIAAHWLYKTEDEEMTQSQVRAQQWVKNLLELQKSSVNSLEFIESVKIDLFPDEVYIFTPKGKIMELPHGATAVDFAYSVHTDIGNSCVAVKIDRQLAPLSTVLSNGQTVEVITSSRGHPNPIWLDFVVTSKARSAIRHFLKQRKTSDAVELGRQLLDKALAAQGLTLEKIPEPAMMFVLQEANVLTLHELLSEIGLGNRIALLTAERIVDVLQVERSQGEQALSLQSVPLVIKGTEGMLLDFATCCYPIPGDTILGMLHRGRGIEVHLDRCPTVARQRRHPERCMPLQWAKEIDEEFSACIRMEVVNRRGILAMLAQSVSDANANIEDINVVDNDGQYYQVLFKLLVRDRLHLARIIRKLRQLQGVLKIARGV